MGNILIKYDLITVRRNYEFAKTKEVQLSIKAQNRLKKTFRVRVIGDKDKDHRCLHEKHKFSEILLFIFSNKIECWTRHSRLSYSIPWKRSIKYYPIQFT